MYYYLKEYDFWMLLIIKIVKFFICTLGLLHNCLQTALWYLFSNQPVLSLLSYERLSKKPLLFKSFTGLKVQEFDDIYDKEISKRYWKTWATVAIKKKRERNKVWCYSQTFQVKCQKQISYAYYRLYITYTLAGFLFDLGSE